MPRAKPSPKEIGPYRPEPYDPAADLAKDLEDPAFREAYEALEEEYAALDAAGAWGANTATICCKSRGLARKSVIPAAWAAARSSASTPAVRAMTGRWAKVGS